MSVNPLIFVSPTTGDAAIPHYEPVVHNSGVPGKSAPVNTENIAMIKTMEAIQLVASYENSVQIKDNNSTGTYDPPPTAVQAPVVPSFSFTPIPVNTSLDKTSATVSTPYYAITLFANSIEAVTLNIGISRVKGTIPEVTPRVSRRVYSLKLTRAETQITNLSDS